MTTEDSVSAVVHPQAHDCFSLGTARRFLEKHGSNIERIVFIVDGVSRRCVTAAGEKRVEPEGKAEKNRDEICIPEPEERENVG